MKALLLGAFLAALLLASAPIPAQAAQNISVTSLADSGDGSLRQALAVAQDFDTIYLTNGMILLTSGELFVNKAVSIVGISPSATVINANNASRVFEISSGTSASLSFMTIENGRPPPNSYPLLSGGGIYNSGTLTIDHCVLMQNRAGTKVDFNFIHPGGDGGGIWNGGTLFLSKCTLLNNTAGAGGEGAAGFSMDIYNPYSDPFVFEWPGVGTNGGPLAGGNGGNGGAIMNTGTATISECTFIANASGDGAIGGMAYGGPAGDGGSGGLGGAIFNNGNLTLVASTLIRNTVGRGAISGLEYQLPGYGGVIEPSWGPPGIDGVAGDIGGVYNTNGNVILRNTVVAQNSGASGDVGGLFSSAGHNFIGNNGGTGFTNGINGDLSGSSAAPLDPQLALFVNYGGATPICVLLPGSPLKDAGDDALMNPPYSLATDQQDLPRLVGAHVDIGAVESPVTLPTVMTLPVMPTRDSDQASWDATLGGSVNPGYQQTTVYFQFGLTTNYEGIVPASALSSANSGNNFVSATISNLANGLAYHYRVVATNAAGTSLGNDMLFHTIAPAIVPGDINGDGIVDSSELAVVLTHLHTNGVVQPADLDVVLSNYWLSAPEIRLENITGLGSPVVEFALTNYIGNFEVEYSSNLINWAPLGYTSPRFQFTDTNGPASRRYYRVHWP